MDVARHREVKTLKAYDPRAKDFKNHAGKRLILAASYSAVGETTLERALISIPFSIRFSVSIHGA
jgi:hypothetical protein